MPFWSSKDKKANQQAATENSGAIPGATDNKDVRHDDKYDAPNNYSQPQYGQPGYQDSQARTPEDGGKREKKKRFGRSRNHPSDDRVVSSAGPRQMGSGATYNQPVPQQHHSTTFPSANSSDQRRQLPEHEPNTTQALQTPTGRSSRGLWSWIPHVKQSAADATVIENVKGLFVLAEQFVSNFYSRRSYRNEVPNGILDRVNCSTSVSTSELQEYLSVADLHNPIITHVLINLSLNLIAFDSMESQESLLPREFQNYMVLAKARTRSTAPEHQEHEIQPALSSYRVLSAFLRSDIQTDQNYLQERDRVIEKVVSRFDRAFQHWASSRRSREDRITMLRKVLETAGDLGIFLFSQPAVYVFNWEKEHPGISDGCVAVWPRLLRVCDNDAQWKEIADHMVPIQLGSVIDESLRSFDETKATDRDIAVNNEYSLDTEIDRTTRPFSFHESENDTRNTDKAAPQHTSRSRVVIQEDSDPADASDADADARSSNTWPSSGSSISRHEDEIRDPFESETDNPPQFQQPRDPEPAKPSNNSTVPTSLRPGDRQAQVHQAVTSHPDHQPFTNRTDRLRDSPLESYESLDQSRRPEPPKRDSSDRYGQSSPRTSYFAPPTEQPWLDNNRYYSRNSPHESPRRATNMTEGPVAPRRKASADDYPPSQDPRTRPNERPRGPPRPSSVAYTPQPRAFTIDSYDDDRTVFVPPRKPVRPHTSMEPQISPTHHEDREQRRPRSSSNSPPKVDARSRGSKSAYPPQAYNRQFSSSNPDRMIAAEDRQWDGRQITPTVEGEYGRGRSEHDPSSRQRKRSSSLSSVKKLVRDFMQ